MSSPTDIIATLYIHYQRGDGEITERTVSITDYNPFSISGYCHLREQYRTFRLFDIRECIDTATGECVKDVHTHLKILYMNTSRHTLDRLLDPNAPVLEILTFIARADGKMMAPERRIIAAACKAFTHDLRITQDQVDKILSCTSTLSLHSFKVAIGRINKLRDKTIKRKLLAASRTIIATQKNVTPSEQEALDYMVKRFAKDE